MLKKKINRNHFFYKAYLFYHLYFQHKCFLKRDTYSQFKEDLFINQYFKNIENGFFVDIGCFHPIKYSNTARLYNKGWSGLNIDINQTSIDLFNMIRKRDQNYCAAISNENNDVIYYIDHHFSPINSINKKFFDTNSKNFSDENYTKKEIKTYRFLDFIKKNKIILKNIDFLNIDAESHDFEILQGFDFKKINIQLICIEMFDDKNKVNEFKFKNYLKKFNYEHINSIGPNGFFEKKS